jgi:protein-disulfide isomerase
VFPSRILLVAAALVAGAGIFPASRTLIVEQAQAQTAPAADSAERGKVEQIVRDYLLNNPEILREMMAKLQDKERADSVAERAGVFQEERDVIYNSPQQVVLGNPKGDVTLVEFFDYNCGYCRKAFADTEALLKSDTNLRLVLKEFPVLGEGSRDAARVAVAVHKQAPGRYLEFHKALLTSEDSADGAQAIEVARKLGFDIDRLSADITDPKIDDPLREAHQIAAKLGIDGTPTYIIADEVVPGAVGLPAIQEIVASVRKCGKATCS